MRVLVGVHLRSTGQLQIPEVFSKRTFGNQTFFQVSNSCGVQRVDVGP